MPEFSPTIINMVSADGPDLTLRQLAVLLKCHEHADAPGKRTVRNFTVELSIVKPAITRAADRLQGEPFEFISRKTDPTDRRVVIMTLTAKGKREVARMLRGYEG